METIIIQSGNELYGSSKYINPKTNDYVIENFYGLISGDLVRIVEYDAAEKAGRTLWCVKAFNGKTITNSSGEVIMIEGTWYSLGIWNDATKQIESGRCDPGKFRIAINKDKPTFVVRDSPIIPKTDLGGKWFGTLNIGTSNLALEINIVQNGNMFEGFTKTYYPGQTEYVTNKFKGVYFGDIVEILEYELLNYKNEKKVSRWYIEKEMLGRLTINTSQNLSTIDGKWSSRKVLHINNGTGGGTYNGIFSVSKEHILKPSAPPKLTTQSISFSEDSGNGLLDANEKSKITFEVVNEGKGDAHNLTARLKPIKSVNGLDYSKQVSLGNLKAGKSLSVSIPLVAALNIESGSVEVEIEITEANNFNADPFKVVFNTQKFRSPAVVVADHKFSNNQGGRIRLGQTVTLELLIQNKGQGKASGINVLLKNPPNVFPGSENPMSIASLQPNETKILSYEFFANKAFAEKEIPLEVTITESYGKFGSNQTLRISLDQTLEQTKTVVVSNQAEEVVKIDEVFLKSESKPLPMQPETLGTEIAKTGKPVFYSLFIGINDYEYTSAKLPNLDKPIADAQALSEALTSEYEFSKENAVVLKNPTRSEIINSLEELARKVTSKDNLLIFYAGHGFWDERLKKGYWLPADSRVNDVSTWIPNSTIKDYIAGIQSKHTLLITDACFSGGIFKTRDVNSEINDYAFSKIYRLASRKAMTSGTLTTVPDDSKFMRSLLKQLTEFDGEYLTSRKLFDDLYTAVVNNTNSVPQFGVIQETGDEGGDFIFIRKK
jgi:hypothetical protein